MAIRKYGPGKFDHVIDGYVYGLTNEGYVQEVYTIYDKWYGMIYLGQDVLDDIRRIAAEHSDKLTPEEEEFIAKSAGAIVIEDNSGFVTVLYYDTLHELEREWDKITSSEDNVDDDY